MCLIIFSPESKLPPRAWFAEAAVSNPDGIGVMSSDGIAKFLGKRKTRRAWRYVAQLSAEGVPYAVHFRWATHGRVNRANCHPFEIPGTGAHLMHNGVLWTALRATDEISDTRIFAEEVMPGYLGMAERGAHDYMAALNAEASGNRLLIMRPSGRWDVVNRHLWVQRDGILYSNTYSIDALDTPLNLPAGRKSRQGQASKAGYLVPALARGYASGPTLYGNEDDDADAYGNFAEDVLEELWVRDYEDALDSGFRESEAEEWANLEEAKRTMRTRGGSDVAPPARKKEGFDWHNRETWDKYPIPGTEYRERTLNRHGENESEDYGTPEPRDMFI